MEGIKVISDGFVSQSKFIKLRNVTFLQNGMQRSWDYINVRYNVYALIYRVWTQYLRLFSISM